MAGARTSANDFEIAMAGANDSEIAMAGAGTSANESEIAMAGANDSEIAMAGAGTFANDSEIAMAGANDSEIAMAGANDSEIAMAGANDSEIAMAAAGTSADDCRITISIRDGLKGLSEPSERCIFTVPKTLRQSNKEAYTPCAVAIGPYHSREPSLKPMEYYKLLYLRELLKPNDRLKEYIEEVKSCENEARRSYNEQIYPGPDEFTKMMLLDGIFIIQMFRMFQDAKKRLPDDEIFCKPLMLNNVSRDMTLLENQIPFFVIERLFKKAFPKNVYTPQPLRQLMYGFFPEIINKKKLPLEAMEFKPKHIVDALRLLFLPSMSPAGNLNKGKFMHSPSATELVAAGVKLTKGESECLFDIKFENGELIIPCLVLHDGTESLFRNIIAFEQCYYLDDGKRNMLSYILFMDQLVDTSADTKLLIDKGIIENWLNTRADAADLINALSKETFTNEEDYYFNGLSEKLFKHCKRPCNKWKAILKRDYCSNPWVIISVIAAVVLLLLTAVQTLCSASLCRIT